MSAEGALAAAIRGALLSNAGVKTTLGDSPRVYDDPPPDPTFPYLTLGRVESKPADASSAPALEHAITLHVWSRYGGRAEAIEVIATVRAALHDAALSVEGLRLVFLFASFADVFRSGDGRTTHGVLRLRAMTETV
ncbi:MAG TPA: DUF3168 domain-containing protein [Vitreimonas sp.]|nr:DUF3168 domain-containing protein [Vitreimonas sp.]